MTQMSLKAARINAKLTQKQVADELKISVSTLKNWEKGITYPKQPSIEKLCDLYNLAYDNIFFD